MSTNLNNSIPLNMLMAEQIEQLCKKNDAKSQKLLFDTYAAKMYMMCCRYTKNEFDAEDVLINGFIKVFRNINRYNCKEENLEKWIKDTIIDEIIDFLGKGNSFSIQLATDIRNHDYEIDIDDDVNAELLYMLIKELPVGYRVIFNLYCIEGYKHKEIARKLNISDNLARLQLEKARDMLKSMLIKKL